MMSEIQRLVDYRDCATVGAIWAPFATLAGARKLYALTLRRARQVVGTPREGTHAWAAEQARQRYDRCRRAAGL